MGNRLPIAPSDLGARPTSWRRAVLAVCLAVPLIWATTAAFGASQTATRAGSAGDDQPIQIHADSGIEWQQNAHLYIARGNAVAIRGPSEVHADTLIAHYRDVKGGTKGDSAGGNTEIYRVDAEGHVMLKRGVQTVVGDRAVDDVDQGIVVVTGKGLKLTTATDVVTARDSLEWYDQKQIAVARGDAVATRNGKTVKADILTAYMEKSPKSAPTPGKGSEQRASAAKHGAVIETSTGAEPAAAGGSKISRIDAQGHVVVSNGIDTGRGDFGVYNADTGIATLIGNVVIARGKDVIRGQRGVIDLNHNVSRMLPGGGPGAAHHRVQGLFVREQHGTAQQDMAPPHPAPAGSTKP